MAFPTGWTLLGTFSVDYTKVPNTDQTDFPVLLLDGNFPSTVYANCDNGGGDLRFSSDSAGSTQLPCEVVSFDTANSRAEVYVKRTLSHTANTLIYIWGKNSGQNQPTHTDTYGVHAVWSANYQGVWHFQTAGEDSSPNGYDLSPQGSPTHNANSTTMGTGHGSYTFSGSNYLTIADASCANLEISADKSMTVMVNPGADMTDYCWIFGKCNAAATTYYGLAVQGGGSGCYKTVLAAAKQWITDVKCATGVKKLIQGIGDSSITTIKCFVEGVKYSSASYYGNTADTNASFSVGRGGDYAGQYWTGEVDEVRVCNTDKTDDWMVTEKNNLNSPSTFGTGTSAYVEVSTYDSPTITELVTSILGANSISVFDSPTVTESKTLTVSTPVPSNLFLRVGQRQGVEIH